MMEPTRGQIHRVKSIGTRAAVALLAVLLLLLFSGSAFSWCWSRQTSLTDENCTPGSYQMDCCSGALRAWANDAMTYHVSTSTSASLRPDITAGFGLWNNLEMSDFTFVNGGSTSSYLFFPEGINLVNIDSTFCTNNPGDCDQGILGFSGTWTNVIGGVYQAVESDIVLNADPSEPFTWGDGTGGTIDTMAVIAHEGGHSAGLGHAGATCNSGGSAGCGDDVAAATMYYSYSGGQPTDKGSLELDDVAAMVYGYPRSQVRVLVLAQDTTPIQGATVSLLNSAAPVNGATITTGGQVFGDVTNAVTLFGDMAASGSYVNSSPFGLTDATGHTNYVSPVHQNVTLSATYGAETGSLVVTLAPGVTTATITLGVDNIDSLAPTVAVTSHTDGQRVNTAAIVLAGTASDAERGDNGIQLVRVNGVTVDNGTAAEANTANWSIDLSLAAGENYLSVAAYDDSDNSNLAMTAVTLTLDAIPPSVETVSPTDGATGQSATLILSAQLSEPVLAATVNGASFTLDGGVSGRVVYDPDERVATFSPNDPLSSGTTYRATLSGDILDLAGNALTPFSWEFTTKSSSGSGGGGGGCFLKTLQ